LDADVMRTFVALTIIVVIAILTEVWFSVRRG
jgi:hypothetical protein